MCIYIYIYRRLGGESAQPGNRVSCLRLCCVRACVLDLREGCDIELSRVVRLWLPRGSRGA